MVLMMISIFLSIFLHRNILLLFETLLFDISYDTILFLLSSKKDFIIFCTLSFTQSFLFDESYAARYRTTVVPYVFLFEERILVCNNYFVPYVNTFKMPVRYEKYSFILSFQSSRGSVREVRKGIILVGYCNYVVRYCN